MNVSNCFTYFLLSTYSADSGQTLRRRLTVPIKPSALRSDTAVDTHAGRHVAQRPNVTVTHIFPDERVEGIKYATGPASHVSFAESTILAVARAYERPIEWHERRLPV